MQRIYLDYNASTPVHPRVAAAMLAILEQAYGNPSSQHWAGLPAKTLVERSRRQVAALLGCRAEEIVFTSGASEADNLAVKGVWAAHGKPGAHIITTQIEHPAVLEPCRFLERQGARVTRLPVDSWGYLDPRHLLEAITADTILVSLMHANNEVGTIQPIEECARIARRRGITFHTDAAQSVGKIPTQVDVLGVDLLSIAGHKLYAPKGTGALYVRAGTRIEPLIHGAGHEHGLRAGTESALLCAALGEACELAVDLSPMQRVRALRDRLCEGLQRHFAHGLTINGDPARGLPNTLNVSFVGRQGGEVLAALDGLAASTGSACHSGVLEPSGVLRAMGVPLETALGAVRFSLGRETTAEEIDAVLEGFRPIASPAGAGS